MEEIKIYRSRASWFPQLTLGGFVLFLPGLILYGMWTYSSYDDSTMWFCALVGVLGGFCLCGDAIKNMSSNKPYLTINDECLIINKGWTRRIIRFANVNSFTTTFVGLMFWHKYVQPKYKFILMNHIFWQTSLISARGTGMKARELRDLLNERLENYRAKSSDSKTPPTNK